MNAYRLSGLLLIPLVLATLWVSFLVFWEGSPQAALGYLPVLVGFVFIMVFQKPIDWWWYNRNPPQLDQSIRHMIQSRWNFLTDLADDQREQFFLRVALYVEGRAFVGKGFEGEIPYDIRCMIAAYPVLLTLSSRGDEDFLLDPYQRVILYKHPFLSPQFPDDIHISEIHPEDGVIIFSMEQLIPGIEDPENYLDIAAYEYCRAIRTLMPGHFELNPAPRWADIERITDWKRENICDYYGFQEMDLHALAVVACLSFPDDFKAFRPDWEEQIMASLEFNAQSVRQPTT